MLKISPENNKEIANPILRKWNCDESFTVLTAFESGVMLGYIIVKAEKTSLLISGFNLTGCDDYTILDRAYSQLCELLVRAAGNYAFNRGLITLISDVNELYFSTTFLKLNKNSERVEIKLNELFKPCSH